MIDNHPITPPAELVHEWMLECPPDDIPSVYIATKAARWGADQELEAVIDVLGGQWEWDTLSECKRWKEFRDQSEELILAARRPKPPSLKSEALAQLRILEQHGALDCNIGKIRDALERLDA